MLNVTQVKQAVFSLILSCYKKKKKSYYISIEQLNNIIKLWQDQDF